MNIPIIRTTAMPADTNPQGDIFGGWLMSQMDLAAAEAARQWSGCNVATVAVSEIQFHKPVSVGDLVSCYAEVIKIGRTSITVKVEVFVDAPFQDNTVGKKVTEGTIVLVALDENRNPIEVKRKK